LEPQAGFLTASLTGNANVRRVPGRIPALDGVRGTAICLVLMWHGVFATLTSLPNHPYMARIVALGRFTWSGVDLFFVLSGFLIGGILLDSAFGERYFAPFYIRRAHRILPLYAIVLMLAFLARYTCRHLGSLPPWLDGRIPFWYYSVFLQNVWMAMRGTFGAGGLGVTWSLAVEEQFYLTLPLIIRYVCRSRLWWIVGFMIVGAPLLRMLLSASTVHGVFAGYVMMPCRADALGWGIAAALATRTPVVWESILRLRRCVYVLFGCVGAAIVALLVSSFEPFTASAFGLEYSILAFFYFLLLMLVLTNRPVAALFSLRPLTYLGTIAYGLYLLHNPLLAWGRQLGSRFHSAQSGWVSLCVSSMAVCVSITVAAISWNYLEKPLIQRGHRLSQQ